MPNILDMPARTGLYVPSRQEIEAGLFPNMTEEGYQKLLNEQKIEQDRLMKFYSQELTEAETDKASVLIASNQTENNQVKKGLSIAGLVVVALVVFFLLFRGK